MYFSIPVKSSDQGNRDFFSFTIAYQPVLFSGSQRQMLPLRICQDLISVFCSQNKGVMTGCSSGVEKSFRYAMSLSPYADRAMVSCAASDRQERAYGLYAPVVVPEGLSLKAALKRRTVWTVKRCSMAMIFPDDPFTGGWCKSSRLVFRACMYHIKPVFIVTDRPPVSDDYYRILPCSFFGIVAGYWVVPHPIKEGWTCDDEW